MVHRRRKMWKKKEEEKREEQERTSKEAQAEKGLQEKECGGRDPESLPKRSSEENKRKGREGRNNIKTRESKEKRMESWGEKENVFFSR